MMGINKIAQTCSLQNDTLMDNYRSILTTGSLDFITLCQAQVSLLTQSFNASWVGVYLRESSNPENPASTNLIPAYFYPENKQNLPFLSEQENQVFFLLNGRSQLNQEMPVSQDLETQINVNNQVVMPLLYDNIFMGLLIVRRNKIPWNESELSQIEKIATTLAIACSWEKGKGWYQQRLQELENIRNFTDNKIDDLLHQLRNPLTALRTFAKLLLKRILPEDNNQKIVQNILREGDRLQQLIQNFQQEDHGQMVLEGSVIPQANFLLPAQSGKTSDLTALVAPLIESALAIAEEKNINIEAELNQTPVLIQGNDQAIQEVLSNLIDNAIKYTPKGGQVKINLVEQDNYQGVKIADNGYGIPKEDQKRIFERKYRGKQEQGQIVGSGLGLAIVKELVTQMKGKIELISPNEFNGTTFIVWFAKSQ
jgi:signal transduction histidine kinase